jgi:uncharacterized membrane protein YagU involved in acid resistance
MCARSVHRDAHIATDQDLLFEIRMNNMKNSNPVLRGAFAGLIATIPMTVTMQALRAWLPREQTRPMPPREVIDRTVDKSGAGGVVDEGGRTALTTVGHLAFGAAAGALYGAAVSASSKESLERSSVMAGIAYGLTVWALAYGVGLPSLGLHPAAADETNDRNEVLIASHIVWGATLGRLTRVDARA